MSTYRAYQVTGRRQFQLVDRDLVAPAPGQVRLGVQSCGVCHSDALGVAGLRPDPGQPVVPGHEVIGIVDALGEGVTAWRVGQRVGLGFLGAHCGQCQWCRRGDFVNCENQPQPGTSTDGGDAEVAYARATGLVAVPDELNSLHAAPLICAGLTTFNALWGLDVGPDALVGVQGLGGLGHLAVQYANKLGYRVVGIARGPEKEDFATRLGAHHYIDSAAVDPGAALRDLVRFDFEPSNGPLAGRQIVLNGGSRPVKATPLRGRPQAEPGQPPHHPHAGLYGEERCATKWRSSFIHRQ